MSAKVLGRVVASTDQPRGPDAQMSVTVPESWISEGATLEVELPRNLACAACGGGGCDACARAGGVSLRGRGDPKETVEITLPKATSKVVDANDPGKSPAGDDPGKSPVRGKAGAIVVRIPQKGGVAASGAELPRGNLLLTIRSGEAADASVARLPGPSVPPPPVVPELVGIERTGGGRDPGLVWLFVAALLAALAAWFLRH
jgi:hypothetical protein